MRSQQSVVQRAIWAAENERDAHKRAAERLNGKVERLQRLLGPAQINDAIADLMDDSETGDET